jgi:UBA-like domain
MDVEFFSLKRLMMNTNHCSVASDFGTLCSGVASQGGLMDWTGLGTFWARRRESIRNPTPSPLPSILFKNSFRAPTRLHHTLSLFRNACTNIDFNLTMATTDNDTSHPSEAQQLALETYTAVTNQDREQAIALLERSQWNVQVCRIFPQPYLC